MIVGIADVVVIGASAVVDVGVVVCITIVGIDTYMCMRS